jgi:aminoacylase
MMTTTASVAFSNGSELRIKQGSVVKFRGDAIVNAANEQGLDGGGLDGAINQAGGTDLTRARMALPVVGDPSEQVRIPTGTAVLTTAGGSLAVRHVVHAVGPNFREMASQQAGEDLLRSAYKNVVDVLRTNNLRQVGCCLISAGVYRGNLSLAQVIFIALTTLAKELASAPGIRLTLFGFTSEEFTTLNSVFAQIPSWEVKPAPLSDLELFQALVRVNTVSGEGPVTGTYRYMANLLVRLCWEAGFDDVVCHEFVPHKPVVLAIKKGADPNLKALLLTSHYDVVPAELSKWTVDPWLAEEKEGKIYGRGTQDMKCVIAMQLCALRRAGGLKKQNFARTLYMTMLPDEEIGGVDGMLQLVQSSLFTSLRPAVGLALDEGLANEGNAFTVFFGERSPMWILVTCSGPTGHGSRFIQDTAVEKLVRFANSALAFRSAQKAEFLGKAQGHEGCAHASAKKLGEVTTLNITFLKAGVNMQQDVVTTVQGEDKVALNVIPTVAKAGIDLRVPPAVPVAQISSMLDGWAKQAGEGVSWKFAPWTQPVLAHYVSAVDEPLFAVFQRAVKQACDVPTLELEVFPAGTDSRFLRQVNIPAFGFSPIRRQPVLLHEHDECLSVAVFHEGVNVYEKVVKEMCGGAR